MANKVSRACANYFAGFQDLSTFNKNTTRQNTLSLLKVASYFTLVLPLFVGLVYGISSLVGRVSRGDGKSPENQKAFAASRKVFGKTIEEQLGQFFKSATKTQKLFNIDGAKIGIIFNPLGEALKIGFMTVSDSVVLVSDRSIPVEVKNRIVKCIPKGCTHSTFSFGYINGRSPFAAFGFE